VAVMVVVVMVVFWGVGVVGVGGRVSVGELGCCGDGCSILFGLVWVVLSGDVGAK
jgi:hypothetical protein